MKDEQNLKNQYNKKTTTITTAKQRRLISIKLDNFWSYDVTWEL